MEESTVLLSLGTLLSFAVLYLVFVTIKTVTNSIAVSSISISGFLVSLAAFCISTPKINGLVLKFGENFLQLSKLEDQINKKRTELVLVESKFNEFNLFQKRLANTTGTATYGIAGVRSNLPKDSNLRADVLEVISKSSNGISHTPDYVVIDSRNSLFSIIGRGVKMKPSEVVVIQKESHPVQLKETASIFDKEIQGDPKNIKISNKVRKLILNSLVELEPVKPNILKNVEKNSIQ